MDTRAILGIDVLMSFVSSIVIAKIFVWPWLRMMIRKDSLIKLVAPHMFFRFIGLSFIIPGVVSSLLPSAFAVPAAYGDLIAGILAVIATIGLAKRTTWAIIVVWIFNTWGAGDLLFAFYQGARLQVDAKSLGATFFIVTAIVPPLLVTHFLIFRILVLKNNNNKHLV